ncbi:MAG TPA: hypothetical protein VNJ01_01945 [Bacteriovoracaceae bacterium]|nr:hypothetical protein [Bacteriovoracaceae bacterium]
MFRFLVLTSMFFHSFGAFAQTEASSFSPARVLGVYQDSSSPTKKSWIIDTGTGIAAVQVPEKKNGELLTSLWGNCRGTLAARDASKLSVSEFCRAVRNPEFDRPEQGLEAYTFGTPETAARNYRKSVIFFSLTLIPGLFSSGASTTTFLIPTDLRQLESKPLETEVRIYRGTTKRPELRMQKLKPL